MTRRIVVCDGDETGQELFEEALRVLDRAVLGLDLELVRFDCRSTNRRAAPTPSSHAPPRMRETGLGLKAATVTPETTGDVGSPNRILREGVEGSVIVRTGRRIPGVSPPAPVVHPIVVVRMAVGDAYGAEEHRTRRAGHAGRAGMADGADRPCRLPCRGGVRVSDGGPARRLGVRRPEVDGVDGLRRDAQGRDGRRSGAASRACRTGRH